MTRTTYSALSFFAVRGIWGFSIEDCRSLLALWSDRSRASADVKAIANGHLVRVKEKLAELEEMRDTLSQLVDACSGDQHSECPILRDLAGEPDRCVRSIGYE